MDIGEAGEGLSGGGYSCLREMSRQKIHLLTEQNGIESGVLDEVPRKKQKKEIESEITDDGGNENENENEKGNGNGNGKAEESDEFDDLEDTVRTETVGLKYTDSDIYLDTVNRKVLNFDMPLICSVSLATTNIHICLVCNRYLQGASLSSPAFTHAVDTNHHVYINTQTSKFIILPEQLVLSENRSKDLRDIQLLLQPKFGKQVISELDSRPLEGKTMAGEAYDVGFVPLVNDYMSDIIDTRFDAKEGNSILKHNTLYYALLHLPLVRDHLLEYKNSESTPLSNQLSNLTKKIWSPYLFKNFTSSFAIEYYLVSCRLPTKILDDVRLFYTWILNTLMKENKKLYKDLFTGKLVSKGSAKPIKFINLTVKLPQQSVFKGSTSSSIEQYDLMTLIKEKGYQVLKFPQYLVIYIDRTNDVQLEGIEQQLNKSIVKFDPNTLQLNERTNYKLLANITDSKVQVLDKSRKRWMEFDGVGVKEVEKELLFIANSQLQIWEK